MEQCSIFRNYDKVHFSTFLSVWTLKNFHELHSNIDHTSSSSILSWTRSTSELILLKQWYLTNLKEIQASKLITCQYLSDTIWRLQVLSLSVMSNSLWLHGLWPAEFLCPWDFPGKNTGVGCHIPSPRDFPNPGIEPLSPVAPALADSLPLSHLQSPETSWLTTDSWYL